MWNFPSITLASQSPRRHDILNQMHIPHTIFAPEVDEQCAISNPEEQVCYLAQKKALATQPYVHSDIIIAADTIVAIPPPPSSKDSHISYQIFGKPKSQHDAHTMLRTLSNARHQVFTGICIIHAQEVNTQFDCTTVQFIDIEEPILQQYLASAEWEGIAGGYRIQGLGAYFIHSIQGSYSTVMGLSIPLLMKMLQPYHIPL